VSADDTAPPDHGIVTLMSNLTTACDMMGIQPFSAEHARLIDMPAADAIVEIKSRILKEDERPMDKTPKLDQLRVLREQQIQRQNERNRAAAQNAKARMKRPHKSTAARKR
jgi:hypothetical protein